MDKLISIREVAELFGLGRTAAYELTHRSGFPAPVVISPHCYRWPAGEVADFAEALRQDAAQRKRRGGGPRPGREASGGRRIIGTVRPARRGRGAAQ